MADLYDRRGKDMTSSLAMVIEHRTKGITENPSMSTYDGLGVPDPRKTFFGHLWQSHSTDED